MSSFYSRGFGNQHQIRLIEKQETRTSRGMLSKAWYEIDGKICMVKANSRDANGNIGYEPYSESMAYKIAKLLGLEVIPYWLMDSSLFPELTIHGLPHVSVCEDFIVEGERLIPLENYLTSVTLGEEPKDYITLIKENLDLKSFYKMLAFDAFIGNEDRHTYNISVIKDGKGYFRLSPIYDNGGSLLAWVDDKDLGSAGLEGRIDKAKPLRSTHSRQIKLITYPLFKYFDTEIFYRKVISVLATELNLLPHNRAKAITQYLWWRLKYLQKVMDNETNV